MVNAEVIRKRLNKLDEYLAILQKLQAYSKDEFLKEPEHYGSAERFLQLSIEAISDIGNHLVAGLNLGVVNWQSDVPALLSQHGYLDDPLKDQWIRLLGFRNILVHEYLDIDRTIVYDVLQQHLEDVENVKNVFARFL